MSVKINSLSEKEIRDIGDAFADFQYAESEFGMGYLGKGRQAVSDYICAYVRMAINERVLYSTSEEHEGFIAFKNPLLYDSIILVILGSLALSISFIFSISARCST